MPPSPRVTIASTTRGAAVSPIAGELVRVGRDSVAIDSANFLGVCAAVSGRCRGLSGQVPGIRLGRLTRGRSGRGALALYARFAVALCAQLARDFHPLFKLGHGAGIR